MAKKLYSILIVILTSFFFFPCQFNALPNANSKMMVAAVGLCIYLYNLARGQKASFRKDTFLLSVFAIVVSLVSLFSAVINGTSDYTYVSYIVSMWVWIGAAYAVIVCIKQNHGQATVRLVGNYLIAACVMQCFFALLIDTVPAFRSWVHTYFYVGQDFLEDVDRLYGIGAALDVAGTRFSAALMIGAAILTRLREDEGWLVPIYILALLFISVVGNMIARTTTVGMGLALLLLAWETGALKLQFRKEHDRLLRWSGLLLLVGIPFIVFLYNTNADFHQNLRYGFEGFFSLVEKGKWDVSSNNTLMGMFVFPERLKTWIIGDGYFENPVSTDPYFTGRVIAGFYMGTDVGYLRFIFYFGLVGLVAISAVFCKSAHICISKLPDYKYFFILLLALNFIVWFKVSTDMLPAFAPFIILDPEQSTGGLNSR